MSTSVHDLADKAGEAATEVISSAAGAVADPKTAAKMVRSALRERLVGIVAVVVVSALVALVVRRRAA